MRKLIPFIVLSIYFGHVRTQNSPVGYWSTHTSFNTSISISIDGNDIYCASRNSIFVYNKSDQSVESFSKVDGLSDIGIQKIKFHPETKQLLIGYETGSIDLFSKGTFSKIDDIKRSSILGSKAIHDFYFIDQLCYISTGFGIVVYDLVKKEVKETYAVIQNQTIPVFQITYDGTSIWAATDNGVYKASLSELNQNPKINWTSQGTRLAGDPCNIITYFNGEILVNQYLETKPDTIFRFIGNDFDTIPNFEFFDNNLSFDVFKNEKIAINHNYNSTVHLTDFSVDRSIWTYKFDQGINPLPAQTIFDSDGFVWIADKDWGLGNQDGGIVSPGGPKNNQCYSIHTVNDQIIATSGSRLASNGNNFYKSGFIHVLEDKVWRTIDQSILPEIGSTYDIVGLTSYNDRIYLASLGRGILELKDLKYQNLYNDLNSTLEEENLANTFYFVGVADVAVDETGNLWSLNTRSIKPLHVRDTEGVWHSFSIPLLYNSIHLRNILITRSGNKWIQLLDGAVPGIVVFNENNTFDNTSDDSYKLLTVGPGNGNLPSSRNFAMAEDLSGNIWVGTEEGLVVFYAPDNILSETIDGTQILVEKDGYTEYLMEHQNITAIVVDGANRKWIASEGVGVFLISEDGKEEIHHFTKENSPLLSNYITSITIHPKTGEVFFATEEGISSYRSDATEGKEDFDQAYVFPNPIKSGYQGQISITNLIKNSTVKITDISGNIVYETISNGGQATWNGQDFNGARVQSGVYLIYCYSDDGSYRVAGKMIFIQ